MAEPRFTINIHTQEDTTFAADRVPSTDTDFVSLRIGYQASVFLMTSDQAKRLADAAIDAYTILREVELKKQAESMKASLRTAVREVPYDEAYWNANCSIENPCPKCVEAGVGQDEDDYVPSYYDADYPDWDDRF